MSYEWKEDPLVQGKFKIYIPKEAFVKAVEGQPVSVNATLVFEKAKAQEEEQPEQKQKPIELEVPHPPVIIIRPPSPVILREKPQVPEIIQESTEKPVKAEFEVKKPITIREQAQAIREKYRRQRRYI